MPVVIETMLSACYSTSITMLYCASRHAGTGLGCGSPVVTTQTKHMPHGADLPLWVFSSIYQTPASEPLHFCALFLGCSPSKCVYILLFPLSVWTRMSSLCHLPNLRTSISGILVMQEKVLSWTGGAGSLWPYEISWEYFRGESPWRTWADLPSLKWSTKEKMGTQNFQEQNHMLDRCPFSYSFKKIPIEHWPLETVS